MNVEEGKLYDNLILTKSKFVRRFSQLSLKIKLLFKIFLLRLIFQNKEILNDFKQG